MAGKIRQIINSIKQSDKVCGLITLPVLNLSEIGVEEFGSVDFKGDNEITGVNSKGFYRISTDVIENTIREIRNNPNSSIITCYNEAFKDGEYPSKISALLKHTISAKQPDALVTALLNYFGAPTTLNFKVIKNIDMEFPIDGDVVYNREDVPKDLITISIDALNEGQEFLTFEEAGIEDNSFLFEPLYESTMTYLAKTFTTSPFDELSEEEKDAICYRMRDQLAMSYLVRKYICADSDFEVWNLGIILDYKNKDIRLINFDYEFAFRYNYSQFKQHLTEHMLANVPDIYNKFVSLSKQLKNDLYESKVLSFNDRVKLSEKLGCDEKQLLDLYNNLARIIDIDLQYRLGKGAINDKIK